MSPRRDRLTKLDRAVFPAIKDFLDQRSVSYRQVRHAPTATSEESAAARGEDLSVGGKALVLKVDDCFRLFVLSAALKIDSAKIKKYFGARKLRFASREELFRLTGLVPGAVPPFGKPITPFELYVDPSIARNERIAFNAGSLTDSLIMSARDYLDLAGAAIFDFSR